jgi:hypothetical protein
MNLLFVQVLKFNGCLLTRYTFSFSSYQHILAMESIFNATGPIDLQLRGPSRAPAILAGNLIPELIATCFFFARVYARAWLLRNWGADDTLLMISWVSDSPPTLFPV